MYWYEDEVRGLEESLALKTLPQCPAVFYGSSSIRLWTRLADDLGDQRALNLGFGGSTLEACAYFFERLIPRVRPASLVVYAGDNDLGDGRSPDDLLRYFHQLSGKIARELPEIPFGFISIKISPARHYLRDKITAVNHAIAAEMSRREGCYFVDIVDSMLSADGKPRPELFSPDGLHLSRAGEKLWARLLEPHREQIFTPNCPGIHTGIKGAALSFKEGESRVP